MNKEVPLQDTNLRPTINIEWLSDYTDCDQAGCSGGYSEGAIVTKDGKPFLSLIPAASCFGGDHWDRDEVFRLILNELGYDLTTEYGG